MFVRFIDVSTIIRKLSDLSTMLFLSQTEYNIVLFKPIYLINQEVILKQLPGWQNLAKILECFGI